MVMINNNNSNNNHQLDQPVITRITSPPTAIQETALFCMFSLFNFSSIFPWWGAADPICPYVRAPMDVATDPECTMLQCCMSTGLYVATGATN